MGTWLTAAELRARYGTARVDDRADRDRDANATKINAVLDSAIADAEGRVKSELVANRFAPGDLPTDSTGASAPLKRVCARLAWGFLWATADVIPDPVKAEVQEGHSELRSLCRGPLSLLLAGEPAVDTARPRILVSPANPDAPPPIKNQMSGWGR